MMKRTPFKTAIRAIHYSAPLCAFSHVIVLIERVSLKMTSLNPPPPPFFFVFIRTFVFLLELDILLAGGYVWSHCGGEISQF